MFINSDYSNIASGKTTDSGDADANAWIARLTNPTLTEQIGINNFVVAEKAANNWSLYDEFYLFSLGATNGLIGAKSKAATSLGGVTFDVNGATFNGTNGYINSNFNPTTDGTNYTQNDAQCTFFYKSGSPGSNDTLFGAQTDVGNNRVQAIFTSSVAKIRFHNGTLEEYDGNAFIDNSLYSATASSANGVNNYVNGALEYTNGSNLPAGIPNDYIYIGVKNNGGTPSNDYTNYTCSCFLVGAGDGFDHAAHNTNVRLLLATLIAGQAITDIDAADAILNSGTTTASEAVAIDTFVTAEKSDSNYALYDEFWCLSLGATNGLNGFKGTKATANGGVTFDVNGADFNGTNAYIDTNFNPNSDGINYKLNDASLGIFQYSFTGVGGEIQHLTGGYDGSQRVRFLKFGSTDYIWMVNNDINNFYGTTHTDDKMFDIARTSNSTDKLYVDGSSVQTGAGASLALPNVTIHIGQSNGIASQYFNGVISTFRVGGAIGFDHAAHNTNVRQLLTDLGVTL